MFLRGVVFSLQGQVIAYPLILDFYNILIVTPLQGQRGPRKTSSIGHAVLIDFVLNAVRDVLRIAKVGGFKQSVAEIDIL